MYLISFFWYVLVAFLVLLIVKKNIKETPEAEGASTGKDALYNFGLFLTLMLSIGTFLIMLFNAIDAKFPDVLNNNYSVVGMSSEQAIMIATLVVVFPLFLIFAFLISKEIKKNSLKKDIAIRKSVVYTLLVASVVTVIGTLIATIYTWLLGSTTNSFLLKAAVIVLVSIILFFYFYYSLKRDYVKETFIPNIIAILSAILIVAGIIWSITMLGTPSKTRMVKLDEQKLQDIQNLKYNIQSYVQSRNKLPSKLEDLDEKSSIIDKETRNVYEYYPLSFSGNSSPTVFDYRICTTFVLASNKPTPENSYFWRAHQEGYQCFDINDSIFR